MFKFNFKKVQIPAFYFAFLYLILCVWFFAGPKVDLGHFSPKGFVLGIDFKGGFVHEVTVYTGIEQDEIRQIASEVGLGTEIQKVLVDDNKRIGKVDTYLIKSTISKEEQERLDKDSTLTPANIYGEKIKALYARIIAAHGDKCSLTGDELKKSNILHPGPMTGEISKNENERVLNNVVKESENVISPTYAKGLRVQVVFLVLFVLILISLYITFRFKLIYGIGAIASLAHDAIVVMGFVSIMGIEFDYNIIAAILFVLGFSINDTVVIFDRIRENVEKLKDYPYPEVVSISVNQTLARSIITSFTTFMAAMALVIWGGPKIEGFSRAIAIGIFFGTYSSIFVASPVVLLWYKFFHKNKKNNASTSGYYEEKPAFIKEEALSETGSNSGSTTNSSENVQPEVNSQVQLSKKQLKKLFGNKK